VVHAQPSEVIHVSVKYLGLVSIVWTDKLVVVLILTLHLFAVAMETASIKIYVNATLDLEGITVKEAM
jgi:hypothetical protein